MRLHSTDESITKREISVLAIVECLVSTGIYIWIGFYLETFVHLALAVALGPLFLMRTSYSYDAALRIWKALLLKVTEIKYESLVIFLLPFVLMFAVFVRAAVTIGGIIKHPYHSLKNIPDNWIRQAICTDAYYLPEVIPGELKEADLPTFKKLTALFIDWFKGLRTHPIINLVVLPLPALLIVCGYLPAIAFRISFKATSLFYLPLIWVITSTVNSRTGLKLWLERITKGELERFRRRISGLVLAVVVSRLALNAALVEREYVETMLGSPTLAAKVLDAWPWWHLSLMFDALMTFALFLVADALLARLSEGALPNLRSAEIAVRIMTFVRGLTAALVVAYFVALAIAAVAAHLMSGTPVVVGT